MHSKSTSIVIPTLNAASCIDSLLRKLVDQTYSLDEIIVVDSSSSDDTANIVHSFVQEYPQVQFHVINRKNFDHGGTRNYALRKWTSGEFVLFMTQDAVPVNTHYVENILKPFVDPKVGLASGRQLPKADARRFEQLVRNYNYPEKSFKRGKADLDRCGIKTFYASNVCSAYRREAYTSCGGFPKKCKTNEDMYMAAKMIFSDWLVAYEADACVYHSHNFTPKQQYERNRVVGRFLEEYKDVFMGASEIGEGKRLVAYVVDSLLHEGRLGELCAFGIDCVARFMGNRVGRKQTCRNKETIKHRDF